MEMLERVARAICKAANVDPDRTPGKSHPMMKVAPFHVEGGALIEDPPWRAMVPTARMVLAAMRQPTETMTTAGDDALINEIDMQGEWIGTLEWQKGMSRTAWHCMIDAALRNDDRTDASPNSTSE